MLEKHTVDVAVYNDQDEYDHTRRMWVTEAFNVTEDTVECSLNYTQQDEMYMADEPTANPPWRGGWWWSQNLNKTI